MRRRVHLHGALADFHDGPIEVVASTIWEAIEAVTNQVGGFKPDPIRGRKRIMVAGFQTRESLLSPTHEAEIHVFPALTFGKNGGLIQTVIGLAMVVVGTALEFVPGGQVFGTNLIVGGVMSLAGGLMQLIAPQPKATPEAQSRYIATTQNTVQIGTPIPILYGRYLIGGQILSLSVTSQNQQFKST